MILSLCVGFFSELRLQAAEPPIDFARQIRPILSDNCFACHGFDEGSRKADVRLDDREAAIAVQDGHAALVPGKPDRSEAWRRILSDDPDEQMPPPTTGKKLTAEQKALIQRWIEEGAPYAPHWAFARVERPAVPAGAAHAIDAFITARLQASGLKLSP